MTFNVTLLKVNLAITDTSDLFNFPCSRQESQTGIWKSWPPRAFMPMDMKMSLGKSSCCGINFISLLEAVVSYYNGRKRKTSGLRAARAFMYFLPLSCALNKTRCFNKEMKPKSHCVWFVGPPLLEMPAHHSKVWKMMCMRIEIRNVEHSGKKVINYTIYRW